MNQIRIILGLALGLSCIAALTGCGGTPDEDPNAGGGASAAPASSKDGKGIEATNMASPMVVEGGNAKKMAK